VSDYKPTTDAIRSLREQTGAGMMDVRDALREALGDADQARRILRERGAARAAKLSGRATSQGRIAAYVHATDPDTPPRRGVLIEVRCNTDFVAKSEPFQIFVNEMLLQIVSSEHTRWIAVSDVPDEAGQAELDIYRSQAADKSDEVRDRIAQGRLRKWYEEVCLLEQPYFRDEKRRVEDIRAALANETGENIEIARFASYVIGGSD
jgi:elongation factor Ts